MQEKNCVPAYFYMVASPAEEEEYIKGIEDVVGRVPIFGGSSADNTVEGKWSIFTNDKIFNDGAAIAFFYTDKEIANVFTGAYNETTNSGVITKVEGKRTLVEIDGVPAHKEICRMDRSKGKRLRRKQFISNNNYKTFGSKR